MAEERTPAREYLELADEVRLEAPVEAPRAGFLTKLNRGLFMTHTEIIERIAAAVAGRARARRGDARAASRRR